MGSSPPPREIHFGKSSPLGPRTVTAISMFLAEVLRPCWKSPAIYCNVNIKKKKKKKRKKEREREREKKNKKKKRRTKKREEGRRKRRQVYK